LRDKVGANPEIPRSARNRLRNLLLEGNMVFKSSKGFTLIEIIIVIVILSIVSAITINFLISSLKIYTMTVNQKTLFDEGKLALERMCRDIRDANLISLPNPGASGNLITFRRTNNTGPSQDTANETITFQKTGSNLEKVKAATPYVIAGNVSTFTVTRDSGNEIQLFLELTSVSGGATLRVTLQTKVYPKNLAKDATYKNFFLNWKEDII
jgi:prepilin-type N-terminal cleavage/methylation domain-containing protein